MTVEELLVIGKENIHSDLAKMLLGELLGRNPLELYSMLDYVVDSELANKYQEEVTAIKEGKPIQYVIGNVNFYKNKFIVNENTLIPRFETEELVDYTIKYINEYFSEPVDIVDLGCGTGVIGISLEKNVNTNNVDLVDISPKALEVTKQNKENLNSKANLIESDMWTNVTGTYDVIMSNPPYIKTDEEIEDIVRDNEPHLALYAGSDGLDCYRKIFEGIKPHMKDRCLIAMEIGYTQGQDLIDLANQYLENVRVEVKKDMQGKDRMVFIFKNLE